jgi:2-polyprenyl-3-methyl-5-hydroxy-6-metoxy-1,4-benzoquinol methylase
MIVDRLARLAVLALSRGAPADALRKLLGLEAFLRVQLDRAAIAYDDGVHAKHRLTGYHDFFVERVRPGERVLDVGCGKAELARDLAERADALVTGLDVNALYLEFARSRPHPRLELVEGDAHEFRPVEPFETVVLSNVLEHIAERPALLRGLAERTGASRFLIRVPLLERDWTIPLRRELGLEWLSDATHFTEYTVSQFETEIAEAGLESVEIQLRWSEIWAEARSTSR